MTSLYKSRDLPIFGLFMHIVIPRQDHLIPWSPFLSVCIPVVFPLASLILKWRPAVTHCNQVVKLAVLCERPENANPWNKLTQATPLSSPAQMKRIIVMWFLSILGG